MCFLEYNGDMMGMYSNDKHLNFKWDSANILFSMCRQGNAVVCNFASDKKSLRKLKIAINEFIDFVFDGSKHDNLLINVDDDNDYYKNLQKIIINN